jgi:ketopantoate hydroxymethyltransferase
VSGKPDLAQLAYRACKETGAEAVICVSNKPTTLRVVTQLREWGIPAYGPIWDS